jgi:tRNA threonylcarbamoyladenosine biosynthesis protein TsaB
LLLAIDTATRIVGIALYDGEGLHVEEVWRSNGNHTAELVPHIVRACEGQDLTPQTLQAVAVSLGPGSFSGLRVGLSAAKGLAMALKVPLLGIPTLDATAYAHFREVLPVCAVLPAGRGRWCLAFYQTMAGNWQRRSDYALLNLDGVVDALKEPTLVCGELGAHLTETLRTRAPSQAIVASPAAAMRRPGYLAELAWQRLSCGESDDPVSLAPIYLQNA